MLPPLTATQTVDRARALLESGRGAALPELLKLIETLSIDICKVTIAELAELIEKDAVVLAKIVSVANKLAHNPGIAPIGTLSQAIHQLGYNRIRTVAVSLMLLDTAGAANPPEQRDAAALALSAGLIAQGAAEFTGTHDPEFVFACAALRNLGRILMAAISPPHYRQALELNRKEPNLDGFRRRFGLGWSDLSRRVLASARLPEEVTRALRDCEPETLHGVAGTYDGRLLGIVDYSSRLATLTLDEREPDYGFVRKVSHLARRFQRIVPGSDEVATPALLHANERLRSFTRCSGVAGLPTTSLQRIRLRLEIIAPGAALDAEQAEVLPVGMTASGIAAALGAVSAASAVETATPPAQTPTAEFAASENPLAPPSVTASDVEEDAAPDPGPAPAERDNRTTPPPPAAASPSAEIPAAWDTLLAKSSCFAAQSIKESTADARAIALTIARDAVGAKECWLFRYETGATALSIAAGVGDVWTRFQERAAIRPEERNVFGLCLTRREVVLIHDTADATLRNYLPPWWREAGGGPRAFSLIPIANPGETTRALVLVGWHESRRVKLTQGQVSLIHQVCAPIVEPSPKAA